MRAKHVRIVELLRHLYDRKAVARLDHVSVYLELARRGVMDPVTHFIRHDGGAMPTDGAISMMNAALREARDMGLIKRYDDNGNPYSARKHVYQLTTDGRDTLLDWDDTSADGLWPT